MKDTEILSSGMSKAYVEALDYYDLRSRPEFSFKNVDTELRGLIAESDKECIYSQFTYTVEQRQAIHRLELECGYLDKLCAVYSSLQFAVSNQQGLGTEETLHGFSGIVFATPLGFSLTKYKNTDEVIPMLVSLTEVDNVGYESEVVEVLTPLDGIQIKLHTPTLN